MGKESTTRVYDNLESRAATHCYTNLFLIVFVRTACMDFVLSQFLCVDSVAANISFARSTACIPVHFLFPRCHCIFYCAYGVCCDESFVLFAPFCCCYFFCELPNNESRQKKALQISNRKEYNTPICVHRKLLK